MLIVIHILLLRKLKPIKTFFVLNVQHISMTFNEKADCWKIFNTEFMPYYGLGKIRFQYFSYIFSYLYISGNLIHTFSCNTCPWHYQYDQIRTSIGIFTILSKIVSKTKILNTNIGYICFTNIKLHQLLCCFTYNWKIYYLLLSYETNRSIVK